MTIETREIRSEPHVEIGSIIARDAAELVQRWCERAREEQPTASRVHHEALRNQLTHFLQAMGHGLLQSGERDPKQHRHEALEHGEQRWDSGWSLAELVRDYQILHSVVLEHLAIVLDRPLGYREAMAVGVFVNDAIAASIAAYIANRDHHVREIERAGMDALREAQARKDEFLAVVVHELRNPMTPIVNAAESLALMLDRADEPIRNAVRLIKRQSRQLARILDDLTDLTRVTQGRLALRREVVDVGDVVDQAVQTVATLIAERGHQLVRETGTDQLRVEGDGSRLVQVVVNLLINAAKYTPPGGRIAITTRRSGDGVEIVVRDTGQGIPPHLLDQVFDMYARVSASTESSPDGLGIGLALVKELAALHGGSVSASSDGPGHGAEFVVSIPSYQGTDPVTRTTPEPMALPSARILVIDDEADVCESLSQLLRVNGHSVDSAQNGKGGMERALGGSYDAAIVDIGLPDVSGFDVAKAIRAAGNDLFLIGLSGIDSADLPRQATDAGFDAYVAKPADADTLTRLLFGIRSKANKPAPGPRDESQELR